MARIRTIKPEFWQDEKLAPLSPIDRLVFLGLISQADDAGRLVDNIRLLDGLIFPLTKDTCAKSLDTLARISRISRYKSESGQGLIEITHWAAHQKVDHPSKYVLPGESSRDSRASTNDLVPVPTTNDLENVPDPADQAPAYDDWVYEVLTDWKNTKPLPKLATDSKCLEVIDVLHRIDKHPPEEVKKVVAWIVRNAVPKGYIKSPRKLRDPTKAGDESTYDHYLEEMNRPATAQKQAPQQEGRGVIGYLSPEEKKARGEA